MLMSLIMTTKEYNPLAAGSVDGTDEIPHDKAIYRAMNAVYSSPDTKNNPHNTVFVGRLPLDLDEEDLEEKFGRAGKIKSCNIIRDFVTGSSRGYGFVEYERRRSAVEAYHDLNGIQFHGKTAIVDYAVSHTMSGWVPRRLGGGWGGRKESGQLRFGCRDRPFKKPFDTYSNDSPYHRYKKK